MSKIARNIASSSTAPDGRPHTASGQIRARKDSAPLRLFPVPTVRISARQLDAIASELTDYDRAVLLFLAEVRLATGWQLARRLWSAHGRGDGAAWAARRALWRMEAWRLVDRLPRRVGGVRGGSASLVYCVGPAGRRLLARSGSEIRRLGAPGERHVRHVLAITELVVRLHTADLAGELQLIRLETEPRCWRGFLTGLLAARLVLKPDLFVRIGAGAYEDRYFVEVDLATEHPATLLAKCRKYLAYYRSGEEQRRHDVFPWVVWIVPNQERGQQIQRVLAQLPEPAQRLFRVWPYEEAVGRWIAEAQL